MMQKSIKLLIKMPDQFRLQAVVNLVKNWSDEWLFALISISAKQSHIT